MAKCVGRKKALELLFCGNLIKADETKSLGLIKKIVPKEDLDAIAME